MYLFKCNLLCLSAITLSLTIQPSEQANTQNKAIIQTPANAMMSLCNTIGKHGKGTKSIPYSTQELKEIDDLIRINKNYMNTYVATSNDINKTVFAMATQHGQLPLIKLFLSHGAQLTAVAVSTLSADEQDAIRLCPPENLAIFTTLLTEDRDVSTTINRQNSDGETVLHDVLRSVDDISADIVKQKACWLIYYGANPNSQDTYFDTAFTIAADDSLFEDPVDRQDLLEILHKKEIRICEEEEGDQIKRIIVPTYYARFLMKNITIKGNVASYMRNRQLYGPWKR